MIHKLKLRDFNVSKIFTERLVYYLLSDSRNKGKLLYAGGGLASVFNGMPFEDHDLFYLGTGNMMEEIIAPFMAKWTSGKWQLQFKSHGDVITMTQSPTDIKLQFINIAERKDPISVLEGFDMFQCRIGWDGENMFSDHNSLKSILKKEIKFAKVEYPVVALKRLHKYAAKGYSLSDESAKDFILKCHAKMLTHNLNDETSSMGSVMRTTPSWSGI